MWDNMVKISKNVIASYEWFEILAQPSRLLIIIYIYD